MAHSLKIRNKAVRLRGIGISIPHIARELSISKSTASNWVSKIPLPIEITQHLRENSRKANEKGREMMRIRRLLQREDDKKESEKILQSLDSKLNKNFWKLYAAILFWCEGSKRNLGSVGFINSDPIMVKTFLYAFRTAFRLDEKKFRIVMHLHNYHNEVNQKSFWSKVTDIPLSQFTKAYIKPNTQKRKRDGYPGCISLKYFDAKIAKKLDTLYHGFGIKYGGV